MNSRRKPWPVVASGEYYEMVSAAQALTRMSRLALDECFAQPYDLPLLEELVPRIHDEWRTVRAMCLQAQAKRQGKRWPRWVLYSLEDITAIALEYEGVSRSMGTFLKHQFWPTLEQAMCECHEAARQVEKLLGDGPPPRETRNHEKSVIDQAMEVVRNYDDKNPPSLRGITQ